MATGHKHILLVSFLLAGTAISASLSWSAWFGTDHVVANRIVAGDWEVLPHSGSVSGEIAVQISAPQGSTVFYTLDGSAPSEQSEVAESSIVLTTRSNRLMYKPTSIKWKNPAMGMPKGMVLRARCKTESSWLPEITRTYVEGNHSSKLPSIYIVVDPKDLFGFSSGIMVPGVHSNTAGAPFGSPWWEHDANYQQRGKESARFAHIEIADGSQTWSDTCSLKIHGNATRAFPQKSLRFKTLSGKAIPGRILGKNYDLFSIILRNGGNDSYKTRFRDGLAHILAERAELDVQGFQACQVFINGEYWGIYNMRERQNDHYLVGKYNLDQNDLCMIENDFKLYRGDSTEVQQLKSLVDKMQKGLLTYSGISQEIDVVNLINYIIMQSWVANTDWPGNNLKMYKLACGSGDTPYCGRWRFLFTDADYGFGYTGEHAVNTNMFEHLVSEKSIASQLFLACMNHAPFRASFENRLQNLLNGHLKYTSVNNEITRFELELMQDMPLHIGRWRRPNNRDDWQEQVEQVRTFANKRGEIMLMNWKAFRARFDTNT